MGRNSTTAGRPDSHEGRQGRDDPARAADRAGDRPGRRRARRWPHLPGRRRPPAELAQVELSRPVGRSPRDPSRSQSVIGLRQARARVTAVLRGRRLDANRDTGHPDLGVLCAHESAGTVIQRPASWGSPDPRWRAECGLPARSTGNEDWHPARTVCGTREAGDLVRRPLAGAMPLTSGRTLTGFLLLLLPRQTYQIRPVTTESRQRLWRHGRPGPARFSRDRAGCP